MIDAGVVEQAEIADWSARESIDRDKVHDDTGSIHGVLLHEGPIGVEIPRRAETPSDIMLPLGSMTPEMVAGVRQIVQEAQIARETETMRLTEIARVEAEREAVLVQQIARVEAEALVARAETARLTEIARVAAEREAVLVQQIARAEAEVLVARAETERDKRDVQIARDARVADQVRMDGQTVRAEAERARVVEIARVETERVVEAARVETERVIEAARVEAERVIKLARMEAESARVEDVGEDVVIRDVRPAAGVFPIVPCPVDHLKSFTSLRVDTFDGIVGSDVESWFRRVDAAFRQIEAPEEHKL